MWCLLAKSALFFLGLPMNAENDLLPWNAHRIYGPVRLPLLTANFDLLRVPEDGLYSTRRVARANAGPPGATSYVQPLMVLRKRPPPPQGFMEAKPTVGSSKSIFPSLGWLFG